MRFSAVTVNHSRNEKNRGREKHCNFNTFRNYSENMSFGNTYNLCKPRDGVPPGIAEAGGGAGLPPKREKKRKKAFPKICEKRKKALSGLAR